MMRKSSWDLIVKYIDRCESGADGIVTESEAVSEGDECQCEVDFEVAGGDV